MKDLKTCIRGIASMLRPAAGRVTVSILIGLVLVASSLGFVALCKSLVDVATGHSDKNLTVLIILLAAVMLTKILAGVFASYWENLNSVRTRNELQHKVFAHVLESSWHGREEFHSGDLTNRLEEDIRVIVDLICVRIPDVVITMCQLVAASIFLMSMAPELLWLLILLMVVGVFGSKLFFKVLRRLTASIRDADSRIQQLMQENLQNRVLVLTLIGVDRVLRKLGNLQDEIERLTVKRLNYNAVARGFMSLGFTGGYAAAFLWGVFGILEGSVTFGMMTAFLQLVGQVQRPVADISRHIPAFIHALTSEERLMELLDLDKGEEDAGILESESPGIVFDNVTFCYPGSSKKVLDNFSFEFKPGCLTAIMGPTGTGKSTLIRLAMGLFKPTSGSVSTYSRRNYMYVPQGNSLMSGTIRENLLLANPDATEEQMKDALKTAAADFVLDLTDGLDSRCGEVGSGLSEGQAQRIAVARALLHEGSILVLDEATSALDLETEERLLNNLMENYRGRKTILFVSHREKIFSMADSLCRITDGRQP